MSATKFQIKLSGAWTDFVKKEDQLLKRAYMSGFKHAGLTWKGKKYTIDFEKMVQKTEETGKERQIRAPHKWRAPAAPICKPGKVMCVSVAPGTAGGMMKVPHPYRKGGYMNVRVPERARPGQAMLVPMDGFDVDVRPSAPVKTAEEPTAPATPPAAPPSAEPSTGPSTPTEAVEAPREEKGTGGGAAVAAAKAGAAAVAIGGVAVGGFLLGEHVAEEGGWEAVMADLADGAETAGDAVVDGVEAAGEWLEGAAEDVGEWVHGATDDVGEWIMDLF